MDVASPLLTDLYQLTMACGYFHHGVHEQRACFHLFYRRAPFKGAYAVCAGIERALSYLEGLSFQAEDIAYLRSLERFPEPFLQMLEGATLDLDVWAMQEGSLAFPHEPMLRIEGPLWQAQLVETALLNMVNFETLVATKAARVCDVARDESGARQSVLEFGLRRAQGPDGGAGASRAAHVGGCSGTSNVLAGRRYGIPVAGTHAHSWIMTFGEDVDAFTRYAEVFPDRSVFLVDTFNTHDGVRAAIEVGRRMRADGHELKGIRLDSGDLAQLSIDVRAMLDEAGFPDAQIVASNDLDEHRIAKLKEQGARIDVWGVGTRLTTAYDQPALGGVYKLGAIQEAGVWQPRMKFSQTPIKKSIPGRLNVFAHGSTRAIVRDGESASGEVFHPETGEAFPCEGEGKALLQPVMKSGKRSMPAEDLASIRARSIAAVDALPPSSRRLSAPTPIPSGIEASLAKQRNEWTVRPEQSDRAAMEAGEKS